MASRITIPLSDENAAPLKSKKVGHECDLLVTGKVVSNDGKTLVVEVEEVEPGPTYEEDAPKPKPAKESTAESAMAMSKGGY